MRAVKDCNGGARLRQSETGVSVAGVIAPGLVWSTELTESERR